MHNGYTQAEGVDNLDAVPATGCLVSIGYPKFKGGLGGYARYVAICPPGDRGRARDLRRRRAAAEERQPLHWDPAWATGSARGATSGALRRPRLLGRRARGRAGCPSGPRSSGQSTPHCRKNVSVTTFRSTSPTSSPSMSPRAEARVTSTHSTGAARCS